MMAATELKSFRASGPGWCIGAALLLALAVGCEDGDEGALRRADADGDGWPARAPAGERADCDDGRALVHPGAPEYCDGRDNQCPGDAGHGQVDEGCAARGVTVGDVHSCARMVNGTVLCWGDDGRSGRLGRGRPERRDPAPGPVPGLAGVAQLAAGKHHTCARLRSGEVRCWGDHRYGQLGCGGQREFSARPRAVAGLDAAIALRAGGMHSCVRLRAGGLRCWGANAAGQVAAGAAARVARPKAPAAAPGGGALTVAGDHSCVLASDGRLDCWGDEAVLAQWPQRLDAAAGLASSGDHACAWNAAGEVTCWGNNLEQQLGREQNTTSGEPAAVAGLGPVRTLALASGTSCAVGRDGRVRCWGGNASGQLGSGSQQLAAVRPVAAAGLEGVRGIDLSQRHGCAALDDGTVRCWGDDAFGAVSGRPAVYAARPAPVAGLPPAAALAVGAFHACAADRQGRLRCWGDDHEGQIGAGDLKQALEPRLVAGVGSVAAVAAGGGGSFGGHSCSLNRSGAVRCWGDDRFGQCGGPAGQDRRLQPGPVALPGPARRLALGALASCALLGDGRVFCWGAEMSPPKGGARPIALEQPAKLLAAGEDAFCAAAADGRVWCWAERFCGLGPEGSWQPAAPYAVAGLTAKRALAVGDGFVCAAGGDGAVACAGCNNLGQLGRAEPERPRQPLAIAGLAEVRALAAGSDHACALDGGGRVHCWGSNLEGQLGQGHDRDVTGPVRVAGLDGVAAIAAGGGDLLGNGQTCALDAAGHVLCWGSNTYGQLGRGRAATMYWPRPVAGVGPRD